MAPSRKLAAIMFTDIVGYTAIMGQSEQRALEFLARNREMQKPIIDEFRGQWIKELGDGVMASFNSVSDAVHAAIMIQQACTASGEYQLRIGIHLGEVVMEGEDVFGDGVNIASRIQALAPPGGILVSESVHQNVANKQGIHSEFVREEILKNVKDPVRIFQIVADGVAGSAADNLAIQERSHSLPAGTRTTTQKKRVLGALSAGLLMVLILITLNYQRLLPEPEVKSLVVLPFKNLSPDPNDKYLADGFGEEVISRLSLQKNLLVIAPGSARQAALAGWGNQELVQQLGIQYVLKGSVQKENDNLRIIARLEDAHDGKLIFSKTLNRKLKNFFDTQEEVAQRVAIDLGLRLTGVMPEPRNLKAWELAQKAGQINTLLPVNRDNWRNLMRQAIEADSSWLEAWYAWEWTHLLWFGNSGDSSNYWEGFKARNKILSVDKDSYVARRSAIAYDYWVRKDFDKVIAEYQEILEEYPNLPSAWGGLALAYRRKGQHQEFVDALIQNLRINPLNTGAMRDIAETLADLTHTKEAMYFREKIHDVGIDRYYGIPFNAALMNGELYRLDSLAREARNDPKCTPFIRADIEAFALTNRFLHSRRFDSLISVPWRTKDSFDSSLVYLVMEKEAEGEASCRKCIIDYQKRLKSIGVSQNRTLTELSLLICQAGAGEKDWKVRLESMFKETPVFNYPDYYRAMVLAALMARDYTYGLDALVRWQKAQCGYHMVAPSGHFGLLLKDNPILDPLRSMPGFEELWDGNHLKIKPLKLPKEWSE